MHVGAVGWLAKRSNETGAPPRRIAVRLFVYTGLPGRVVFGFDELAGEIRRLKCSRTMLLCAPRQLPRMRRWGRMPLADMILALEEMQVLAEKLPQSSGPTRERL
jgi:hypothetical protein